MKITIQKETVAPMTAWLKMAREQGVRDEKALREILSMPDYGVEFQRYGDPGLPVCGIGFEEAVDFFLHLMKGTLKTKDLPTKKNPFWRSTTTWITG